MSIELKRTQADARRIAEHAYPYPGCCLCGCRVIVDSDDDLLRVVDAINSLS